MSSEYYTAEKIKNYAANSKQILFEVTNLCNMSCLYCGYGGFYEGFDKRDGKNLSVQKAKNLVDYYYCLKESSLNRKIGKKIVFAFYGGEPLLNFSFIREMVGYIRKKKMDK